MTNIPLNWVWIPAAVGISIALPLVSLMTAFVLRRKGLTDPSREALKAVGLALFATVLPPLGWVFGQVLGISVGFAIPAGIALLMVLGANVLLASSAGTFALELYLVGLIGLLLGSIALRGLADIASVGTGPLLPALIGVLCLWSGLGGALAGLVDAVVLPLPDEEPAQATATNR